MRATLLLLLAASVSAQNWSTLTPAVGGAVALEDGFEAWEAGPGLAARLETPAYHGRARADLRVFSFDALEAVPDFTLAVATLGWGPALEVGPVRLGAGAKVGGGLFRIDDDTAGNLQNETELAVGGWLGGTVRRGRIEVWAEVDGTHLTLSEPTTLVSASGGLALQLGTPRWLRTVLE